MTLYTRLQIPTFDLIWVDIDGHYYIFCPGGGGATKSGLRNGIQIFEEKDDILTLNFFHETVFSGKSTFVFQLCASNHQTKNIICALFDNGFAILEVFKKSDDFVIHERAIHVTDSKDAILSCCCFATSETLCVGGNDGIVRIFSVLIADIGNWQINYVRNLECSSSVITSLSYRAPCLWLMASSKDGTIKIWDMQSFGVISDFHNYTKYKNATKFECRGCLFHPSKDTIISLNSVFYGKQVISYIVEWTLQAPNSKSATLLLAKFQRTKRISDKLLTKICISSDGQYVGVSSADGAVLVYATKDLRKICNEVCHQLPVTGLSFNPNDEDVLKLNSCSADNALTTIKIQDISLCVKAFVVIGYLIVTILGIIFMIVVFVPNLIPRSFLEDEDED